MDHHEKIITPQKAFKRNVQALFVICLSEKAGDPFEDDGGCLFTLDSKVIVDAAAMTAVSSVITIEICSSTTTLLRKGSKREQNQSTALWEKDKLHVFVQQRKAQKSSLTILHKGCSLFSRLYIACQTRKGDLPFSFRHENQPPPPPLSKLGNMRTGKKADLLSVLNAPLLDLGMLMRKKS